jgi:hypothetical protein
MMTMDTPKIALGFVLATALFGPTQAQAALSSFFVDWSGAGHSNAAEAHGILTVDDAFFSNDSGDSLLLPGVEVVGFSLTVSDASLGDLSFQLSDFDAFSWSTASVPLDLSQELVGQLTYGGAVWGGLHDGKGGDFNLLAFNGIAPSAVSAFTLSTSAGLDMDLVSFRPVPVPLPAAFWLFGSGLAGFMAACRKAKKSWA